jgi:hypothetical protein
VAKDDDSYPHAKSEAATMLSAALRRMQEQGKSIRKVAFGLGYSSPAVLSHMASGRVPIPIDNAPKIAKAIGLGQTQFLMAVMDQRHPEVSHLLATGDTDLGPLGFGFVHELEFLAGGSLDQLNPEQKDVMRQVVRDASPAERWLSHAEMRAVQMLRDLIPTLQAEGLKEDDRIAIQKALTL